MKDELIRDYLRDKEEERVLLTNTVEVIQGNITKGIYKGKQKQVAKQVCRNIENLSKRESGLERALIGVLSEGKYSLIKELNTLLIENKKEMTLQIEVATALLK